MEKQKTNSNPDQVLRELLKNEFQRRAEKNPAFSLRALSVKLDIDQSLLSKLLQGKRKFSSDNIKKVSDFLGIYLNPTKVTEAAIVDYDLLKEDEFFVVSGWLHFAILELIKTKTFKNDVAIISKRLGASTLEVERALERLERLGFIEVNKSKITLKRPSNSWLNFSETNTARKNLQKQLHTKAVQAIEDVAFENRDHSILTVAVDPKLLPEIKNKITAFRRSLDKFIEENGNQKEVYNLCLSFFPLTKTDKEQL
jgi:predicted transcriptional regulator